MFLWLHSFKTNCLHEKISNIGISEHELFSEAYIKWQHVWKCIRRAVLTYKAELEITDAFSSAASRIVYVGELLPACRGSSCSAAAADPERKWHALCPVQLLPVQSWWPQSRGPAGVCPSQRRPSRQSSLERVRVSRQAVAPGRAGCQHLLA